MTITLKISCILPSAYHISQMSKTAEIKNVKLRHVDRGCAQSLSTVKAHRTKVVQEMELPLQSCIGGA